MSSPDGLRDVRPPLEPILQSGQIRLQVLGIHRLGHPIDAGSRGSAQLLEALPQQVSIHQMEQTGEPDPGFAAGLSGYAMQFRCHRSSAAERGRCGPTSLDHVSPPFLRRRCPPSPVLRGDPTPHVRQALSPLFGLIGPPPVRGRRHGVSRVAVVSSCHACRGLRPRGSDRAQPRAGATVLTSAI